MKRLALAAVSAFFMLGAAHAQQPQPLYGELGYTSLKVENSVGAEASPGAIRAIVGYEFHRHFAVEGMLAAGVRDDDANVFGINVNVKLKHAYGVYLKPKFDVTPNFEVFARLGYSRAKLESSALGTTTTNSDDDFSYGAGVNYRFNPRMHVGLDYMRYFDKDGEKINGWTIGLGYRF